MGIPCRPRPKFVPCPLPLTVDALFKKHLTLIPYPILQLSKHTSKDRADLKRGLVKIVRGQIEVIVRFCFPASTQYHDTEIQAHSTSGTIAGTNITMRGPGTLIAAWAVLAVGVLPAAVCCLSSERVEKLVKSLSLKDKAGQMVRFIIFPHLKRYLKSARDDCHFWISKSSVNQLVVVCASTLYFSFLSNALVTFSLLHLSLKTFH